MKVVGSGESRVEAMRLAVAFGARTLDATSTSFVFELTGATEEIETVPAVMSVVGLVEVRAPASPRWAAAPRRSE